MVVAVEKIATETKQIAERWTGSNDIPPVPAADGTYTLTATRSNGIDTYNWV